MSDPGSSLPQHKLLAQATRFLDNSLRVVQYGICGVAAFGLWRVLRSARAFSHFARVEDVPLDFIQKNVRLNGRVRSIGTPTDSRSSSHKDTATRTTSAGAPRPTSSLAPPSDDTQATTLKAVTSAPNLQTSLSEDTIRDLSSKLNASPPVDISINNSTTPAAPQESSDRASNSGDSTTVLGHESPPSATDLASGDISVENIAEKTLSDNVVAGSESRNRINNGTPEDVSSSMNSGPREDSDLSNADYRANLGVAHPKGDRMQRDALHDMGAFKPLFLEVEHVPVFQMPHHNRKKLLPLKVAAIEVPAAVTAVMSDRLINKKVWFRLLYIDASSGALVCAVTRQKFGFGVWRSLNEEIVRTGEGVVSRLADPSDALPLFASQILRQGAGRRLSALWYGAPSPGALALVDDQQGAKQDVLPVIPSAYHKLYGKLLRSEARARKKRLGVWKEGELEGTFLVRLWSRFRNNTRKMRNEN